MTFFAGTANVTFNFGSNASPTFHVSGGDRYIQECNCSNCSNSEQYDQQTHSNSSSTHVEPSRRPNSGRIRRRDSRNGEIQGRTRRDESGWTHNSATNNNAFHGIFSSVPNSSPSRHYSSNRAETTWGQHASRRSSPDVSPRNRYPYRHDASRDSHRSQARYLPRDEVEDRRLPHNSHVNDSDVQIILIGSDIHYSYSQIDPTTGQRSFHLVVISDDVPYAPEPYPAPLDVPNNSELPSYAPPSYLESFRNELVQRGAPFNFYTEE